MKTMDRLAWFWWLGQQLLAQARHGEMDLFEWDELWSEWLAPRKPYNKPRLKCYGSLHDVTHAVGQTSMNRDNARHGKADLFTA